MSNYPKKPKCEGGCPEPYAEVVSKKDGKRYEKCMTCDNLVFSKDKRANTTPAELCTHAGSRIERVSKKEGSAGRRFTICGHCEKDFKWMDVDENQVPPQQQQRSASTSATYSLPTDTLVQDLGAKVDAMFKNMVQMQAWISDLQIQVKTQDEQLVDIIGRLPATSVSLPGGGHDVTEIAATNKRRKT